MARPMKKPGVGAWAGALAAAACATLAARALDGSFSIAGLSMLYLLAVATSALLLPRRQAAACALLCVTSLNYFFVPPRGSLAIDKAEHWWILATLLGLALALSGMVARLKAGRAQAEMAATRARRSRELGAALSLRDDPFAMAREACLVLAAASARPSAIFLRSAGSPASLVAMSAPAAFQQGPAQWVIDNARAAGQGCDDWPDLPLWCAPFGPRSDGAVQILFAAAERLPQDELAFWGDLVAQTGAAIERKRAAAAAKEAHEQAQAEAARNTLLASLSHDLRTPLAGLLGSASTLRQHGAGMSEGERSRLLANLEDEALDLSLMADNVLEIARLAQPSAQVRKEWESLGDVLSAAVTRMRRRWPAAGIVLRTSPGLPLVRVEARLLAQAIANLVDNAVRHGGAAQRIVVQTGRSREGVFVAVRDFGRGLPPGNPSTLFERWRAGGRGAGGSGLGLAICELVARAHAGSVEAKRENPGAEFRIDLPVAEQPPEPAP